MTGICFFAGTVVDADWFDEVNVHVDDFVVGEDVEASVAGAALWIVLFPFAIFALNMFVSVEPAAVVAFVVTSGRDAAAGFVD